LGKGPLRRLEPRGDFDARVTGEPRFLAFFVEKEEERERNVGWILRQRARRVLASLLGGLCARRDGCEVAERAQAPLALHALAGLGDDGEHSADTTALVTDRAVGKGEEALLEVAVPIERNQDVVERDRLAAERLAEQRADEMPDLRKDVGAPVAERHRVLRLSQHRTIPIVVEEDE